MSLKQEGEEIQDDSRSDYTVEEMELSFADYQEHQNDEVNGEEEKNKKINK